MGKSNELSVNNIEVIEEQYKKYETNPNSVDPSWKQFFEELEKAPQDFKAPVSTGEGSIQPDFRVYNLIQAYRSFGHLLAQVNPVATKPSRMPPELDLKTYHLYDKDLNQEFPTFGLMKKNTAKLSEILAALQKVYCSGLGIEYMGLNPELEKWLQSHIETQEPKEFTIEQKRSILQHLNRSEIFETFLHTKYVGQKRFSLEGGETLIPMLEAILEIGTQHRSEQYIIGMAHRGRLNVLANILNKSYSDIFSEFEEGYIPDSFEGSGDVKYHKGFISELELNGKKIYVLLNPNPSHLESVYPVVEGQVRARQELKKDAAKDYAIPIIVHGDASLSGQGVVYETLQLYKLKGYSTGGTIHIVVNNQIGFTTLPRDARSTYYCTDIAKTFGAPVFHVNAENAEECVYAAMLAAQVRYKFHCDVFLDLVCYRKYGHNETDEPAFTQPLEYQMIRKKKSIREIYIDHLIHQGIVERSMAETLEADFKKSLQDAMKSIKSFNMTNDKTGAEKVERILMPPPVAEIFKPTETGVPLEKLQEITKRFCEIPPGLTIHSKLEHVIKDRLEMVHGDEKSKKIDWGMGEFLAYGTLLCQGVHVRLSGQDCGRGTFSHRHALWVDQVKEKSYYPLNHIQEGQASFDVFNSSLSEYAILAFEFGYNLSYPNALVIWEAQFGDFANGAQIVIDQYIATTEQKWGQKSSLVLYLPHGYEGQGPEHSSARMERFLALAGDYNMFLVNPTTPLQLFHLLRRQMMQSLKKPLVVFTPKSLLRHPECTNSIEEFTTGSFQELLDDPAPPKKARRVILCNGHIYYELAAARRKAQTDDLAIVRLEQLYPLHMEKLLKILEKYKGFKELLWVQEEPSNMGAWDYMRPILREVLPKSVELKYIGRGRSASPAAGSYALHKKEHSIIMNSIFENQPVSEG